MLCLKFTVTLRGPHPCSRAAVIITQCIFTSLPQSSSLAAAPPRGARRLFAQRQERLRKTWFQKKALSRERTC